MSSNCEPTLDVSLSIGAIRDAFARALTTSPTFETTYPVAKDVRLVIKTSISEDASQTPAHPWPTAKACVSAEWVDPFQIVPLQISNGCVTKQGATVAAAKTSATTTLALRVPGFARDLTVQYGAIIADLQRCRLEAPAELSQLFVAVGDGKVGPFQGRAIELACLPKKNLEITYQVDGKPLSHIVSPADCATAASLPVPPAERIGSNESPGSQVPSASPSPSVEPSLPAHHWAVGVVGAACLVAFLVVLLRNAFNPEPMNKDVVRFLRIIIALIGAAFAAFFTGFLTLSLKAKGFAINAGAGMAMGVLLYLFDPPGRVKRHKHPATAPTTTQTTHVVIVFLASNPAKTTKLAIGEEARDIEIKIRASEHRELLDLRTRWAARTDDLLQTLNEDRPTIVHFSGHGAGAEGLVFTAEDGTPKLVTGATLEHVFRTLKDNIRVVVLNACYSKEQAKAIVNVVDCVIGMNEAMGDVAARKFAAAFYRALGFGRSVKNAFDQGIAAIKLDGLPDDKTPELLVRDGVDADDVKITPSDR